jgi:ankyrin repeat protein
MRKYRSLFVAGMVAAGMGVAAMSAFSLDVSQMMEYGTPARIQAAIQSGLKIEARQKDNATPLMIAAGFNSNPQVVSVLLKAGANVNDRARGDVTPLMYAAFNRNPRMVSALLSAGAKLDVRGTHGETSLMLAAAFNPNPKVISALVKAGANVNERDSNGRTALMYGALNPNPAVISELIADGAKVAEQDSRGMTPLMWAALDDQSPKAVSLLLKAGAAGQLTSNDGKFAYDYAAMNPALKGTPQLQELKNAVQTAEHARKAPQA